MLAQGGLSEKERDRLLVGALVRSGNAAVTVEQARGTAGCGAEQLCGPHAPRRICILATCGIARHKQLLFPWLLHLLLGAVLKGRRQLQSHRCFDVAVTNRTRATTDWKEGGGMREGGNLGGREGKGEEGTAIDFPVLWISRWIASIPPILVSQSNCVYHMMTIVHVRAFVDPLHQRTHNGEAHGEEKEKENQKEKSEKQKIKQLAVGGLRRDGVSNKRLDAECLAGKGTRLWHRRLLGRTTWFRECVIG